MLPRWSRILGLLFCLCLCLQLSHGQSTGLVRRQDGGTSKTPQPMGTREVDGKTADGAEEEDESASTTLGQSGGGGNSTATGSDAPSSTGTGDPDDDVVEGQDALTLASYTSYANTIQIPSRRANCHCPRD